MDNLKYIEILNRNKALGEKLKDLDPYDIVVLSNITVNPIKEILEYSIRTHNIFANVYFGDYDNIIQECFNFNKSKTVIIFWEIINLIDGLQYKIESLSQREIDLLIEKTKSEINLALDSLQKTPLIIFNLFTSNGFSSSIYGGKLKYVEEELNIFVKTKSAFNFRFIDLQEIIVELSLGKVIDHRGYYTSKSLYSINFYKSYVENIKWQILSNCGKSKKALVLDCDNTIWQGIVGEDGLEGIKISKEDTVGKVYYEVQSIIKSLAAKGVIIGLCSKNEKDDVDNVIKNHPDFILSEEEIIIKRINWNNKADNIREIAYELNIGLDSVVFIDDSSFEIGLLNKELPEVTTVQVPQNIFDYPKLMRTTARCFYNNSLTEEDLRKNKMYKEQIVREGAKQKFSNIEDYLKSLGLEVIVYESDSTKINRMSQMTQKTNQFNLTTKRYTEKEIENFINDKNKRLFAISVKDKFGEHGITGLAIIDIVNSELIEIDTFLQSCRIIGRNIEYAFMDYIIAWCCKNGITQVKAKYVKTNKNSQVKDFYITSSFNAVRISNEESEYILDIADYKHSNVNYIKVFKDE